jgi:hypothetical protein
MSTCVCESSRKSFAAEIAFHFPGLEGLKKPIVWVFPKVEVCLSCGAAEFAVPEKELNVLRTERLVEGAVASV